MFELQKHRITRRHTLHLLAGVTGGMLLHGCSQKPELSTRPDGDPSNDARTLSVGVVAWPGYAGHYVALEKKFYEAEGINVQEVFFQDGSTSLTAFLAGKLDLTWGTSADAIQSASKNSAVKVIKLVDYSDGADGILGRGINSPADLKGKKIAREDLLFENILLQAYLEKGGLTLKDVTLIDASAATSASAFVGKQVDVAVTYEPYLTKSAKAGDGKVIYSTKGTNLIADVITTLEPTIQSKKEAILAYLRAVDKAVKLVNSGDEEALSIVSKRLGASIDETKQQLTGLKVFDLKGDKEVGFNRQSSNSLIQNLEFTVKVASALKLITQPIDVSQVYDDSLIRSL